MWTKGYIDCFSIPTYFSWNYHHHCTSNPLVVWMLLMRLDSFRQKSRSLGRSGSSNTLICSFGGYFLYGTDGAAQVWCPQTGLSHYKYQSVPAWGLQGNPNFSSEIKMIKHRTKSHIERRSIIGKALTHHELTTSVTHSSPWLWSVFAICLPTLFAIRLLTLGHRQILAHHRSKSGRLTTHFLTTRYLDLVYKKTIPLLLHKK